MKYRLLLALLLLSAIVADVHASLSLPSEFSDHMILQRSMAVPVWGKADPGQEVTVTFAGQAKKTSADAQGAWRLFLDPLQTSSTPADLSISCNGSNLTLHDVLVGEVWVAGGQSNMGFPLRGAHNAAEVLPHSDDPLLRFFAVRMTTAAEPQANVNGTWKLSTQETAKDFSAVAYFFALQIRSKQNCPVGIIQAPWGGTPIETWMSLDGLKQEPALTNTIAKWDKAVDQYHQVVANPKLETDYQADLKLWNKEVAPAFNAATKAWNDDKAAGKSVGEKPKPSRPEPINPDPMAVPGPSRRPGTPSVSFNGMIAPLIPYGIRGIIWYQGEANGGAGMEYRSLFPRLIGDWRSRWATGMGVKPEQIAFLFVQLPANGSDSTPVAAAGWPWLREAQLMALKLPKIGMAITLDVGDPGNVHPIDKLDVGNRLALAARKVAYGENIVASGPLFAGISPEGSSALSIRFTETGGGLTIGQSPWYAKGVEPWPQDKLIGFFVAGEDKKWVEAQAQIKGDSVIVSSPNVPKPVAVRYGWANSPRCNLYNKEGLPASPFRSDDWETTTSAMPSTRSASEQSTQLKH